MEKINERDIVLSDTIICSVLKIEAEAVGVSLEEYVDRFLEVFYSAPENFNDLVKKTVSNPKRSDKTFI